MSVFGSLPPHGKAPDCFLLEIAVRTGRAAARRGDRDTASTQLDVETSSLRYRLGMFPLHKVDEDLEAAWGSASLAPPDWAGVLKAIQSALATFHWYARTPARGLLAAYNDVANAYIMETNPAFRSEQRQHMLDYLAKAERELGSTPDGQALAEKTRRLISRVELSGSDIKSLLVEIQTQIQSERERAGDRYWETRGSSVRVAR
jgi:hypothetical protein